MRGRAAPSAVNDPSCSATFAGTWAAPAAAVLATPPNYAVTRVTAVLGHCFVPLLHKTVDAAVGATTIHGARYRFLNTFVRLKLRIRNRPPAMMRAVKSNFWGSGTQAITKRSSQTFFYAWHADVWRH